MMLVFNIISNLSQIKVYTISIQIDNQSYIKIVIHLSLVNMPSFYFD